MRGEEAGDIRGECAACSAAWRMAFWLFAVPAGASEEEEEEEAEAGKGGSGATVRSAEDTEGT